MNIRNLLIAATLVAASGTAFAGKAPVILGGFQTTGIVNASAEFIAAEKAEDDKKEDATKQDVEDVKNSRQ